MDEFTLKVNKLIDNKLSSMTNMVAGNHAHNGYDINQLDPAVALKGWSVIQVADATVNPLTANPNDRPNNGTFRFYVDRVPVYRLWAYITYTDINSVLVGTWKSITLT